MELLAPSRRLESAYAAFNAGADAVYIGIPGFNARRMAGEVTLNDLSVLSQYAKNIGKKVYGALNILVKETETKRLIETLEFIDEIKLDAVIFHDLAVLEIASKFFPDIKLHASTQMFIHNSYALEKLYELGVKRVVLPRELSYSAICEIKKSIPKELELEVFIHGALCHSVSGMCLFSGIYTGKSGNRGMCIQLCRKIFKDENQIEKAYFSMKDLHSGEEVLKLKNIADTLKIEGRLKSPEWTYNVVKYYRGIIDKGFEDFKIKEKIKSLFSRETTKGVLFEEKPQLITNNSTGHTGLSAGKVINVSKGFVTLSLSEPLSVRDGIFSQRSNKAFSLKEIFVGRKKIYKAHKGEIVSFRTPKDIVFFKSDTVFKHSDNTSTFKVNKIDETLFLFKPEVEIVYTLDDSNATITAYYKGTIIGRFDFQKYNLEKSEKDFSIRYNDIFEQHGENSFKACCKGFEQMNFYIRLSQLKDIKRDFYKEIDISLREIKKGRVENIYNYYYGEVGENGNITSISNELSKERVVVESIKNSLALKNLVEKYEVIAAYREITNENFVIAAVSAYIDDKEIEESKAIIENLYEKGVKSFYALSLSTLLFLNKIFKEKRDVKIHGGPFLYSINRIATKFLSEKLGVKSFTVAYEFSLDRDVFKDNHFIVDYSEIVPLFFNCKSEGEGKSFFQKEFAGPFEKVSSIYWGDTVLYSKKPFGIKTEKKSTLKYQREIRFYKGNDLNRELTTNYSFVIC